MTKAVCLECGRMKDNAWTQCQACGYQPSGAEDLAKSLLLTEDLVGPDQLAEFAVRHQRGEPWIFSRTCLIRLNNESQP